MTYKMNGKRITKKEAYNQIRELIPTGGAQYLDNLIETGKEHEVETLTVHIGNKSTLTIEF